MLSKLISFPYAPAVLVVFALTCGLGCDKNRSSADQFIVGEKVKDTSAAIKRNGAQASRIAVFDGNVGRIHLFETSALSLVRSFPVDNADQQHYVLYSEEGDYIIDLCQKHMNIIKGNGQVQRDPVHFIGTPLSTVFRPDLGLLAIYDDKNSLVLLQLAADGQVQDSWEGGALISEDKMILAGDMTDDGRLVFAVGSDTLAIVDAKAAIAAKKKNWEGSLSTFPHPIDGASWLAALRGQPNVIMMAGQSKIVLIDLSQKTVVNTYDTTNRSVLLFSKSVDPHIVLDGTPNTIVFARANALASREVYARNPNHIWQSSLDLQKMIWRVIDFESWDGWADEVRRPIRRSLSQYDFSTMRGINARTLPDGPRTELMTSDAFGYFPASKFGHAASFSPTDASLDKNLTGFNIPYLHR